MSGPARRAPVGSVGVGVGFPLFVPDARAYRRDPGGWRIRLHFERRTQPPVVFDRHAPLPGS